MEQFASEYAEYIQIGPGTDEYEVWKQSFEPRLGDLPDNVLRICAYGFTEILNNVVDHSGTMSAMIKLERSSGQLRMIIFDEGIGIFAKIQSALHLANEHEALLELSKGRLTTDPVRHTGEGIFFTARMFDHFTITSGTMFVSFRAGGDSWVIEEPNRSPSGDMGTIVTMTIDPSSKRTTKEVFDRFASVPGNGAEGISRTRLAITLAQPQGEPLISRSQAKRILARLDQFEEAVLDFEGVPDIGPAFADEIFRVFAIEHPSVRLIPIEANESVTRSILRARESSQNKDK